MTATDELRRLLDERGVPWKDYGYENHTWWGEWHAGNRASVDGLFLKVEGVVTPEQAIEATLGSDLQAENEKLQEQIETLVMYVESDGTRYWVDDDGNQHFDHSATVKDDADKLRELVRELYDELDAATQYDAGGGRGVVYEFADKMRELGVEV